MASTEFCELPTPGFSFENCRRNGFLMQNGYDAPKTTKTGTTICAAIFKDGVVLGADTRATAGNVVMDKNCSKIHTMAPNMLCCGAGTAADCDKLTRLIESQLKLHRLNTGRQSRVVTATTMISQRLFQYQGQIGAYLILGGVDITGPHLNMIMAHGSISNIPYGATGSGMMGATAVLESRYKENMTEQEAKDLVHDAILAGIFNDMGSGSNVDIAVIKANDVIEYIRPYDVANKKGVRRNKYKYPKGTTAILKEIRKPISIESETVTALDVVEPMST